LPSDLSYLSIINYSPRGRTEISIKSRQLCDAIKNGNRAYIKRAIEHLKSHDESIWRPFFNENATLVPISRSSLLQEGALWPAKEIAACLLEEGLAREMISIINRKTALNKSALQPNAEARPSVDDHYRSFEISRQLISPTHITLVDDVLTLGRTSMACALKLKEAYPDAEIRFFSVMRTQSLIPDIEQLVDISNGNIHFNTETRKTTRVDQ
jgi:predicted amidophosphoribosyltransferase